jgi:hypothetical protein
MIEFKEMDKFEIYSSHNNHYDENAKYFKILKGTQPLCIYGILKRNDGIGEAFWILDSFEKDVLSKKFFNDLFKHCFSLGYKEMYTWTRCGKLENVFGHFKKLGIEKIDYPTWDKDETKTWFMKRL